MFSYLAMVLRQRVKIERSYTRFSVRPCRRSGRWIWFDPEEVPPFEGEEATFIIELVAAGKWRVVQQWTEEDERRAQEARRPFKLNPPIV